MEAMLTELEEDEEECEKPKIAVKKNKLIDATTKMKENAEFGDHSTQTTIKPNELAKNFGDVAWITSQLYAVFAMNV